MCRTYQVVLYAYALRSLVKERAMGYKPADLFLGIADIFVIMVPGFVAIAGALLLLQPNVIQTNLRAGTWMLLVLASYLVGHFVSGLGSALEDFVNTSRIGKWRVTREQNALGDQRAAAEKALGRLAPEYVCPGKDLRRMAASAVILEAKAGAAELLRRDADRRLFRNLTAVALTLLIAALGAVIAAYSPRNGWLMVGSALFLLLSAARYHVQDKQFSRAAYELLILHDALASQARARGSAAGKRDEESAP